MKTKAVWVIGHGSSHSDWVQLVDGEIKKVHSPFPIVVSFLEKVEGRLIKDGIVELERLCVEEVLVIPLFVSTASTHISEIKDILMHYKKNYHFYLTKCMDDHELVINHIIHLALGKSSKNDDKNLLLIAHGSDVYPYDEQWKEILDSLIRKIKLRVNLNQVEYATFLPYTINLKLDLIANKEAIVVPLFLSSGIFTNRKIPKAIEDYSIKYKNQSYLSQEWIYQWIEKKIEAFQLGKYSNEFLLL